MTKGPTFQIHFQVGRTKHKLFPDLTDEELFAIGRVTASFAFVEHAILVDSLAIVHRYHIKPFPERILSVSFDQRLEIWRRLVRDNRKGVARKKMLNIAKRMRQLQRDRNRITHGLWSWEYSSPGMVTASTFKPNFEFTEPFDFKKLLAVSEALGEISFSLTFPKGKAQAWKSFVQNRENTGFSASRGFAMMMSGEELPPSIQRQFDSVVPSKPKR
jgi:hypothetical protein